MALKTYASQVEVPEALRGEYVEKDGKWIPNVEGAEDLFAGGLKKSRDQILDEKKKVEAKLAQFEGIDIEKAKAAIDAQAKLEEEKAKAAGNFEQLKTQLIEQHTKALEKLAADMGKRDSFINRLLVENAARQALEPVAMSVDLMLPHVTRQMKVKADGDNWVAVVVDEKGNERIKDGAGAPFTIADLVAEMASKDQYAAGFKGTGASGSGAKGSGTNAGAGKKTIKAGDTAAFNANLDAIIKGDVIVVGD
jgi:hypothetical protein